MKLPSGLVFYLDFKYGTDQAGKPPFINQSLFGGTGTKLGSTDSAVNGLYGQGRFGYTINDQVATGLAVTSAPAAWINTNFTPELSASVAAGEIQLVTVNLGSTFDHNGVRAFTVSGSGIVDFYPAFTSVAGSV